MVLIGLFLLLALLLLGLGFSFIFCGSLPQSSLSSDSRASLFGPAVGGALVLLVRPRTRSLPISRALFFGNPPPDLRARTAHQVGRQVTAQKLTVIWLVNDRQQIGGNGEPGRRARPGTAPADEIGPHNSSGD